MCVSVCPSVTVLILAANDTQGFVLGFSFSKKPSVQKLWREKANMQMS